MQYALHKVMALADGELRVSEVPSLVRELARSPALVRALQVFMAFGRDRISRPYAAKLDEPAPQWLIDTIMNAPAPETRPRGASRLTLAVARAGSWIRDTYARPAWSLAAGPAVAAVLGATVAWLLMPAPGHGEALLAAQLQRAIETTGNGEVARLLTFRPVLTFAGKDQAFCRQFEVRSDSERTAAVACRTVAGEWRLLKETSPFPTGTLPAGSSREELDRFVASMINGAPLESEQVKKLSANGWQEGASAKEAPKH